MRCFSHVSSPKRDFTVKKRGISKFCFFKDNLLLNEEVTKQNGMGQMSKINFKKFLSNTALDFLRLETGKESNEKVIILFKRSDLEKETTFL